MDDKDITAQRVDPAGVHHCILGKHIQSEVIMVWKSHVRISDFCCLTKLKHKIFEKLQIPTFSSKVAEKSNLPLDSSPGDVPVPSPAGHGHYCLLRVEVCLHLSSQTLLWKVGTVEAETKGQTGMRPEPWNSVPPSWPQSPMASGTGRECTKSCKWRCMLFSIDLWHNPELWWFTCQVRTVHGYWCSEL